MFVWCFLIQILTRSLFLYVLHVENLDDFHLIYLNSCGQSNTNVHSALQKHIFLEHFLNTFCMANLDVISLRTSHTEKYICLFKYEIFVCLSHYLSLYLVSFGQGEENVNWYKEHITLCILNDIITLYIKKRTLNVYLQPKCV